MIKKSLLSIAAVAAILMITPPVDANAYVPEVSDGQWKQESSTKWWYQRGDGSYLSSGVFKLPDNKVYGFNGSGYLAGKGWLYDTNEYTWYYLTSNGNPYTGWIEFNGSWYYLDPTNNGAMVGYGAHKIGGVTYYFDYNGEMITNGTGYEDHYDSNLGRWVGCYILLGDDGLPVKKAGWNCVGGQYYYVEDASTGKVKRDSWIGDYYVMSDGAMADIDDIVYQYTGGNKTYYSTEANRSYIYVNGDYVDVKFTGKKYQFGHDGKLIKGLYKATGDNVKEAEYKYSKPNGEMIDTGWFKIGDDDYYMCSNGYIATGKFTTYARKDHETKYDYYDNGEYYGDYCYEHGQYEYYHRMTYYFTPDGKLIKGWYQYPDVTTDTTWSKGQWVYTNASGLAYDGWLQSGSDYYYLNNGKLITNSNVSLYKSDDGKIQQYYNSYYFDPVTEQGTYLSYDKTYMVDKDGKMVTGWYNNPDRDPGYGWMYIDKSGRAIENGWILDNNKYYYIRNSYMVKDTNLGLYRSEDGKIEQIGSSYYYDQETGNDYYLNRVGNYYFDKDGAMITGWYDTSSDKSGSWVYCGKDGLAVEEGWVYDNNKYYFMYYGYMQSNTSVDVYTSDDGKITKYNQSYYWDEDGNYHSLKLKERYYFNQNGEMVTGWYDTSSDKSGSWIYCGKDGKMVVNDWVADGSKYCFMLNGYMYKNGFITEYADEKGEHVQYNDSGYYENGYYHSLQKKATYYVDKDGHMVTGWFDTSSDKSGSWIYARKSGALVENDWVEDGGKYYFMNGKYMATSSYISQYASEDGKTVKYNQSYYYDEDGKYIYLYLKNKYYVDKEGRMITGTYTFEGEDYGTHGFYSSVIKANSSGILLNGWTKIGNDWYCYNYGTVCKGVTYLTNIDSSIRIKFDKENPDPVYPEYYNYSDYGEYQVAYREYSKLITERNAKWSKVVEDNTYVFDINGKLVTGWYQLKDTSNFTQWLYADSNGKAVTGWVKSGGKDYYIREGVMLTNTQVGKYYLGADGAAK